MKKGFAFLLLLLFGFQACTINEPKLPKWDTEWTLYLPSDQLVLADAVDDDVLFADTTAENIPILSVQFDDSTEWERIKRTDLSIGAQTSSYDAQIGLIEIEGAQDVETDTIHVGGLLPPELQGGILPPYPGFNLNPPSDSVSFTQYEQVHVQTGNLWLTFHNGMFFTLAPGMQIDIFNNTPSGEQIGTIVFVDSIPSGTSAISEKIDLHGKSISNKIRIDYTIPIAGSDTSRVLTAEEQKQDYFYSMLSMDRLVVDQAIAKIPEQSFTEQDSFQVDNSQFRLRSATITEGGGRIELNNQLPLTVSVRMELPEFVKNGQPRVIVQEIPAKQQIQIPLDLTGWSIENGGAFVDYIHSLVDATVQATENAVEMNASDFIHADVQLDSLYFASVDGEVNQLDFEIAPVENSDINFLADLEGGVQFPDLEMRLDFENEVDFPVDLDLWVVVRREENGAVVSQDSIHIQETIQKSSVSEHTKIVLDKNYSSPSIGELIGMLPTSIRFYGSADLSGSGGLAVNQGVRVKYEVYSPLSFNIQSEITQENGPDTLDLDADTRDVLANDIQEAYASVVLTNGIPLGADAYMYIGVDTLDFDNDVISDSTKKMILHGFVTAGETDASGYVSQPTESIVTIPLSRNQLELFNNPQLYSKQVIVVQPTGKTVRFRQADELKFEAMIRLKYRVNIE